MIAQAEGILSARHCLTITEATAALRDEARAAGVPIDRHAEDLVGCVRFPRGVMDRGWLDLDEEVALQEEMRCRRPEPLDLDAVTEALLSKLLR